ncbi:alpha/beta hydrolase [Limimaricola sp. G21655-S1]|uniref:alpha/beta fold hydrolase n=1 Tax=Limimaricola sp. G21655-S1 TaxID=3014768 RepID=UPI0022AEC5D6|nr:alpha/beta hydrolase [Limimaricola sp. G21655-S1]MCZ4260486.1 alpha/beta hydrolase [Limimaricola sp. G21655-S1]
MADGTKPSAAPFFAEVADGPAAAQWIAAADGVRLRAVHWDAAAPRGTVLILTGRTEYAEKYGRVASDLVALGYGCATLDWRGQGLSHRGHDDAMRGHVDRFSEYQDDLDAFLTHVQSLGLPRPYHMLAHSMGGCIGLRALIRGVGFDSACFTAPMWGVLMRPTLRVAAWGLSSASRLVGLSHLPSPGRSATLEEAAEAAEANMLTRDQESFDWVRRQVALHPELGLAAPSLHWLHEALRETWALSRLPSPALPCLTLLGTEEWVVDSTRIRQRMARWPGAALEMIEGGRHELLIEDAETRGTRIDRIARHFG